MNGIGWAVEQMRDGQLVRRSGWNGKGMWIRLLDRPHFDSRIPEDLGLGCLPFVIMKTADNKLVPWLCSQIDLLALDWERASPSNVG